MNVMQLVNRADEIAEKMTREELVAFIHDYARMVDEKNRGEFLKCLKKAADQETAGVGEFSSKEQMEKEFSEIMGKLGEINEGELCLDSDFNEEYDDWYDSEDDEFIFSDDEGIGDIVDGAADFVHRCVDFEEYGMAYDVGLFLLTMDVVVGGEYGDGFGDNFNIQELVVHELAKFDYKKLGIETIYAAYRVTEMDERAETVADLFGLLRHKDIKFEDIIQCNDGLPDLDEFLKNWISYLGEQHSGMSQRLLTEAVMLADDDAAQLESAREYYINHPSLYEQYLIKHNADGDDEHFMEIGDESLNKIDPKYLVRGRIALMCAERAKNLGQDDRKEHYYFEAFRSDSNLLNYLRLRFGCADYGKYEAQSQAIYRPFFKNKSGFYSYGKSSDELSINRPGPNDVYFIAFLEGEFRYVAENAMSVKAALGWSLTFMKTGIAAFALLLLDGEELHEGCLAMCQRLCYDIGFERGAASAGFMKNNEEPSVVFWKIMCRWKQGIKLTTEQKLQCLNWLKFLVKRRVDGIMEANRRKYYGECASFIAALGEVEESWGNAGAKQAFMEEHRMAYSRRYAFRDELCGYGMIDRRKKG